MCRFQWQQINKYLFIFVFLQDMSSVIFSMYRKQLIIVLYVKFHNDVQEFQRQSHKQQNFQKCRKKQMQNVLILVVINQQIFGGLFVRNNRQESLCNIFLLKEIFCIKFHTFAI
eukprot:TRINITY_DN9743_c0_g1_i2.p5 TRINITY_DN9743_c0_g1~~TRINITY_DN9743_c0_g1_i2.p5  ORF type:complete len:114 (-),score=0.12 TRINITY_DN9743_c0_g1_i2:767-1108(-)